MSSEKNAKQNGKKTKVLGQYKRQGWAEKALTSIDMSSIKTDTDSEIMTPGVIRTADGLYYPGILHISLKEEGLLKGAYLIEEDTHSFHLHPLDAFLEQFKEEKRLPLKYRTLEKINGDSYQTNWPEFS